MSQITRSNRKHKKKALTKIYKDKDFKIDNNSDLFEADKLKEDTNDNRPSRDILKISPEEAKKLEQQKVGDTNINDMLRVLIRRGYDGCNPALAKGSEHLLLTLNCIRINEKKGRSRGRGRGRGRGRDRKQNFKRKPKRKNFKQRNNSGENYDNYNNNSKENDKDSNDDN